MLTIVYFSGDPVHDRVLQAFYDGCPTEKRWYPVDQYEPSDVAVVFGVEKRAVPFSKHRGNVISEQRAGRRKCVVLETGYLGRGDDQDNYYAAGFGGLNGRADFRNQNSPHWRAIRWPMKAWIQPHPNQYILLAGQVPWDASVQDTDHIAWLNKTAQDIRRYTDLPIFFRPHPKFPTNVGELINVVGPVKWDEVRAVVTFNSNLAVDALMNGVPVFVDDIGSMALQASNRFIKDVENPQHPSRTQWLSDLTHCQWTPDEMRQGMTWNHLFAA